MSLARCCAALVATAAVFRDAVAAPAADVVDALPGWDKPLFSKTYSGYIPVGGEDGKTMYEHYLFFESEGDVARDPIIMWTNGGPGASSFFGSFSELGPYFLSSASLQTEAYKSSGVPTLFENAWRWTKLGSLLIRNLPPPIGFSYCDPVGPAGDGYSCGSWNDTKVAKHSATFMRNWMASFAEYSSHDLYLAGESYAGIYVPMLARELVNGGDGLSKQLKGIAVGDGCLGKSADGLGACVPEQGPLWTVEFFHGHGQFSDRTYADIMSSCPREELVHGVRSDKCKSVLNRMDQEKGYSFDYNLYDECYDFALQGTKAWHEDRRYWGPPLPPREDPSTPATSDAAPEPWHMDGSPCGGTSALPRWVEAPGVKKALHVPANAVFFTADNGEGFTFNFTEPTLLPWYQTMAEQQRLRVLIYNGDADPGLNSFYAQNWTSHIGVPEVESWRPWTRDGKKRMGGFVTRYAGNFDFLTIRGSGHMVPEYKPEAAFVMLQSFLHNEEYPRLNMSSRPSSGAIDARVSRAPVPSVEVVV